MSKDASLEILEGVIEKTVLTVRQVLIRKRAAGELVPITGLDSYHIDFVETWNAFVEGTCLDPELGRIAEPLAQVFYKHIAIKLLRIERELGDRLAAAALIQDVVSAIVEAGTDPSASGTGGHAHSPVLSHALYICPTDWKITILMESPDWSFPQADLPLRIPLPGASS